MRKLLLAAALFFVSSVADAASLTERIDRTFDVRPGADVVLSNVNGRITITAWDQPRVRVVAVKEVEASRDNLQQAMKALRVELQPRNGGLTVKTHHPENRGGNGLFDWLFGEDIDAEVTYELTVPRSMNLDVQNTNGSIHVTDVAGKHELGTTNGRIEVARCAGSLDVATTNGAITAELRQVTQGQPLRFSTTNGRIEVALPANLAVDLDAGTTNGSIRSDLPVATTRIDDNSLRGTINGGGTSLRMRTTNGGIAIRSLSSR